MAATSALGSEVLETSPRKLVAFARSETGRKTVKYAAVSLVAIAVSQLTLGVCYGLFHMKSTPSQLVAFVTSTIPSYFLNRQWVWGKGGKSHFWREVAPFWGLGLLQLLISLSFVRWAQGLVENATESHGLRTIGFLFNNLFIYGVMWVGKFMLFNKVLFVHRDPKTS